MDLLLKGGILHDPVNDWEGPAEILIKGDRIEAVSLSLGPVEVPVLDLKGKIILPGMVDIHAHLREPGNEGKETIATGCAAAVAGGFTAVACMPNTDPPVDSKEIVNYIKERARQADLARVYPIGALTGGLKGQEIAPMWEMAQEGVRGFSDDGRPVMNGGLMLRAMQFALVLGLPVISHCEDLSLSGDGVVHDGVHGYRLGLPVIPAVSEAVMVAREILLQQKVGGKLHLAHISAGESVALLRWARESGINLTAEVTPHHLLLTEEAVEYFNTSAKMNPPLRSSADRDALLEALQEGLIEIIATDHAPHRLQEKEADFLNAPFGVTGLETAFPLLWTKIVEQGILSLSELVKCLSTVPANLLGVPGGNLTPGSPADLVVIEPHKEYPVNTDSFFSLGQNTPFKDWRLKGFPVLTMVDGDIKMWEGKVKGFSKDFPELKGLFIKQGSK
ncbi:MAG: dihydroorotase [Dethiobacter sp.]|jgi:dihydroorotase|nr:MAG: dihydroorotase [Dethiobacter sp.]